MSFFKEHRTNISPEQVGATSIEEKGQLAFDKLDPDLQKNLTSIAETEARRIHEQKILEEREKLIQLGKNPDQKELF
jgi:hypothetical protein